MEEYDEKSEESVSVSENEKHESERNEKNENWGESWSERESENWNEVGGDGGWYRMLKRENTKRRRRV